MKAILVVGILAALITMAAGGGWADVEGDLVRGQELIDAGDYSGAVKVLSGIISHNPDLSKERSQVYGQVQFKLGLSYLAQNKHREAIAELKKGLEIAKSGDAAWKNLNYWLGQSYVVAGDYDSAMALYQKYIEEYPDEWSPREVIWYCLTEKGKHKEALAYVEKIYEEQPNMRAGAMHCQAATRIERFQEYEKGITILKKLFEEHPDYDVFVAKRLVVFAIEKLGRLEEAEEFALSRLTTNDAPDDKVRLISLIGDTYYNYKRYREAARAFGNVTEVKNASVELKAKATLQIGLCYRELKNDRLAKNYMLDTIRRYPNTEWSIYASELLQAWEQRASEAR
ncbi:MAG: tetratricopeptide repeat protein [Armatimonadetes bacterium]|nr:tetratricopeptide repeat protein [Armatimonadota bacterium]